MTYVMHGHQQGSGWQFLDPTGQIRFNVDRIHQTSRGLEAWVEVWWQANIPGPRLLHMGTYNLMGPKTPASIAAESEKALGQKLEFRAMALDVCRQVYEEYAGGSEPVRLADVPDVDGHKWVLHPLVEGAGHTRLIAAGGSAKSLLSLAVAVTVAGDTSKPLGLRPDTVGPVVYVDYEADAETHAERLRALCRARHMKPPGDIIYIRARQPLHRMALNIARRVGDEGAVMLVVDSVMLARGASGEGSAEDSTLRLFEALAEIAVPALLIDHKNAQQVKTKSLGGYGSIVMTNSVRREWDMTGTQKTQDGLSVRFQNTKVNNSAFAGDLAWTISFTNQNHRLEQVCFEKVDATTVTPLITSSDGSHADRIATLLLHADEPLTYDEIAEATGIDQSTVRKTMQRHADRYQQAAGTDNRRKRWTVAGQHRQEGDQHALPDPY